MTLIPAPGKGKCTEAKGYHPISLLFFMLEMMQKLVARHIREVHRNHNASCDYTYTGSSGKQVS